MKNLSLFQIWAIISLFAVTIISFVTIQLPFRGDERHFIETIKIFSDNFNLKTLKDYPEVTPPFFYVLFALWSKIFGYSVESLRIFNSFISFIAWILVFRLNEYFIKEKKLLFLYTVITVLNPYFLGMSGYVFTDMLTISLVLLTLISFFQRKYFYFAFFSALSMLTRQYAVIFPVSVILYSLLSYRKDTSENKKFILASLSSLIPILVLFVIWGSISPKSGKEIWIIPNANLYNLDYINSYMSFSILYCLPAIILILKKLRINYKMIILSIVFSIIISLFPIKTSLATLTFTDYKTIGFAHVMLTEIFGLESITIIIFTGILLLLSTYININIISSIVKRIKAVSYENYLIFYFVWIIFLAVMPFSYQVWEKYFVMVQPFFLLSIYLFIYRETSVYKSGIKSLP